MEIEYLCEALRKEQRNSEHPERFEQVLFEAFKALGLKGEYLGGANEPDIILEVSVHKVVIDAKTTKEGVISETYINFEAMERYKAKYVADDMGVVAPGFSTGNIRSTAQKRTVALIETEAVCRLLENHKIYPYEPEQIYRNLFSQKKEVIMPADISPSTEGKERLMAIICQILSLKSIPSFTIGNLDFLMRANELLCEESEIKEALNFLSEPPFNILKQDGENYSFTCELEAVKERLGLVWQALGIERYPSMPTGDIGVKVSGAPQKVTAGEFIHKGGGIFHWGKDDRVRIDANKSQGEIEKALEQFGLYAAPLGTFRWLLRTKAGLLKGRR
jgi:hypothetical protein